MKQPEWTTEGLGYSVDAVLIPSGVNGYIALIAQLPGVISQGDDEEEALANITEAFRLAIEAYKAGNHPIPWRKEIPFEQFKVHGYIVRRIVT